MTPPVTPEPLSAQELAEYERLIRAGWPVAPEEILRLIAQARAATNEQAERTQNSLAWLRDQLKQKTEEYEAAVAAMQQPTSAVRQRPPWQPIETAPHNKPVLVSYINALGNRRTVKATYYDAGMLAMADEGDVDDADENGNNVHGGWFEESEEIEACALLSCAPTHWQPLPAPPAQDGGRP